MKILITSGGCKVPIDEVRNISNFSSGRYGSELMYQFWMEGGHDIIFFHEKGSEKMGFYGPETSQASTNSKIRFIEYKNYFEYLKVKDIIKEWQPDIIISAAAISDYIVDKTEGKISSDQDELTIKLKKGEKIIQSFRELAPKAYIVGFKLLVSPTPEEKYDAISKQLKHVNVSIYNDLTKLRSGEGGRELVYWAENGKLGSAKDMDVYEIVDEILADSFFNKIKI